MNSGLLGGRDAAPHAYARSAPRPGSGRRPEVYRHSLIRLITPLLTPLEAGAGWSHLSLALGAILMSWDPSPTLAQRFESTRATLNAALPRRRRVGRTYQGFAKALAHRSPVILEKVAAHLRTLSRRAAGEVWRIGEFVPIGVDGSRFDAPRTVANETLGFAGKDRCAPQMAALLLVHLGSMLPWAWTIGGARRGERACSAPCSMGGVCSPSAPSSSPTRASPATNCSAN